jgi:hypothetical protein
MMFHFSSLSLASILVLLSLSVTSVSAQTRPTSGSGNHPSLRDRRAVCKFNRARAHLPVLSGALRFKPHSRELLAELEIIDTDAFCDCTFDALEAAFGTEQVRKMGEHPSNRKTSPEQQTLESLKTDAIYFACFGRQISQPQLTPPTVQEINRAVRSAPQPSSPPLSPRTIAIFEKIQSAIKIYEMDEKRRPGRPSDLVSARLLTPDEIHDEWGKPVFLKSMPDGSTRIISPGPDGTFGTRDDLEE